MFSTFASSTLPAPVNARPKLSIPEPVAKIILRREAADIELREGIPESGVAAASSVDAADVTQRLIERDGLLVLEHLMRDNLGRDRRVHDRRVDFGSERLDRRGVGGGIVANAAGADLAVVAGTEVGAVLRSARLSRPNDRRRANVDRWKGLLGRKPVKRRPQKRHRAELVRYVAQQRASCLGQLLGIGIA